MNKSMSCGLIVAVLSAGVMVCWLSHQDAPSEIQGASTQAAR